MLTWVGGILIVRLSSVGWDVVWDESFTPASDLKRCGIAALGLRVFHHSFEFWNALYFVCILYFLALVTYAIGDVDWYFQAIINVDETSDKVGPGN